MFFHKPTTGEMQTFPILFMMVFLFDRTSADLKSCSEETDQLKICFTNKNGYVRPSPVDVDTTLDLKGINDINVDKNSISIEGRLLTTWKDPGLAMSNGSVG